MPAGSVFAFGPFQLDPGARRLSRGDEPIMLPDRHFDLLLVLVSRAGDVVSKDALIQAAWRDVAVTDNSLEQAISRLRRLLGPTSDGAQYIQTLARRGYRFLGPVSRTVARQSTEALDALVAPFRAFIEGRSAIETLDLDAVAQACRTFNEVIASTPEYAPAHIGLANALALTFDATRADASPDIRALQEAIARAHEACRLEPESGEVWATLAFVLSLRGAAVEAVAAGRRAIALEPDNWRHHLRLAYGAWGEERLRAAHQALRLLPGLGLAHWIVATVHVARQSLDEAAREVARGSAAQDRQREGDRFSVVGLHLLGGLILLAQGDSAAAEASFVRELEFAGLKHVYGRQVSANTWCAIGAMRLNEGHTTDAIDAFSRSLAHVPGHVQALAAMSVIADRTDRDTMQARLDERLASLRAWGASVTLAITQGVLSALVGRHDEAARLVCQSLEAAPAGRSSGWTLPVEPLLGVSTHPQVWSAALAVLRSRAA